MAAGTATTGSGWDWLDVLQENLILSIGIVCVALGLLLVFVYALCRTAKKRKDVDTPVDWIEGPNVCIVRKDANEAMGVSWEEHTLVSAVIDGSAAARCGLRSFIGRRVTHINNAPVRYLSDIRKAAAGTQELVLRFSAEEVPVTIQLAQGLDQFSEEEFLQDLSQYIDYQVNLISVLSVTEDSASSISVRVSFAGASPTFVTHLMRGCGDLDGSLPSGTKVIAISIGAEMGTPRDKPIPHGKAPPVCSDEVDDGDLFVSAQWVPDEAVSSTSGAYLRRSNLTINGQPVWEKSGGGHWVYSTPNGHWCITNTARDFVEGSGVVRSQSPHGGTAPELCSPWISTRGGDADVVVSMRPQVVQGYRVGQRITSAEDITERSRIIVPFGRPGWVKGPASKVPECGLKIRFELLDRDVNVLAEEVDNANGPIVGVLSPGGMWRQCMIINSSDTHVKIHYIGYNHEFDEWIELGSDRVKDLPMFIPPGSQVRLRPGTSAAMRHHGSLTGDDVGVVVASEGPQHLTPVKVVGLKGEVGWYSANSLVVVSMRDASPVAGPGSAASG
eukprot:Hpha_TRINITY_DN15136_c2_g7::TRINITY_DN15136_c2_g7_i1::g.128973::m.128973